MITATIAQERSASFELYVKKYRSLLDMHRIPFGSPADLPGFMQQLSENRHLAMDFWALTGRLSKREGGDLSDEEMLALVVESVVGGELSEWDDSVSGAVNDLSQLLAGVDIARPNEPTQLVSESVPLNDIEALALAKAKRRAQAIDLPIVSACKLSPIAEAEPPVAEVPVVSTPPVEVEESVAPVEPEIVQKELAFEETANKIEPPLDTLEPLRYFSDETRRPPSERMRLVLEPEPAPDERELIERADLPSAPPVPLQGYSDGSSRSVPVFVVLMLMIGGGVFVQQRYGSSLKEQISTFVQQHRSKAVVTDAPSTASVSSAPTTMSAPAAPTVNTAPSAGGDTATTQTAESAPVTKITAPAKAPLVVPSKESARDLHAPAPKVKGKAAEAADEDGPISVAPALMAKNLQSSRLAIYPAAAKRKHVQGRVVVQAIISKDGVVTDAQALSGDRVLRRAAVDAVRRFRYKPFLYNKTPIEVATTVNVDFKLKHR